MARTLANIKVGSSIIKLVSLKTGFKVTYGSLFQMFSDLDKARTCFDDTVKMFTENYSRNAVDDFNRHVVS